MGLKKHLQRENDSSLSMLREQTAKHKEALQLIDDLNLRKAHYIVSLHSDWESYNEKSTTTEHEGSIDKAIQRAEQEFRVINHRNDIQASYRVFIKIGNVEYSVPREYWKKV